MVPQAALRPAKLPYASKVPIDSCSAPNDTPPWLAVVQFVAVGLWLACHMRAGLCPDLRTLGLAQWLAALALFGYGQSLNAGIFQAIGHIGVYYGFKLGHTVPWAQGWPFDTISHPQYVGSVLSVWALVALLWGQVSPAALLVLASYWTGLYVVTGLQEEHV